MSVSRQANAKSWLAPAESARARISPSSASAGQLLERHAERLEMVVGVVGAGVARPQDARQHLPPARDQQRVKAEPALVMAGGQLLLRMGRDRRRVELEHHPLRCRPRLPSPLPGPRPRPAYEVELPLADREQHPPRSGDRGDLAEQRRLAGQRRQIGDAPPAVGQHHRQVAEHPPGVMARAPLARARKRPRKHVAETQPLRHERQQRGPRARAQTGAVRPHIYRPNTATSHHLQGEPPERGDRRLDTAILPAQADISAPRPARAPALTDESRLASPGMRKTRDKRGGSAAL